MPGDSLMPSANVSLHVLPFLAVDARQTRQPLTAAIPIQGTGLPKEFALLLVSTWCGRDKPKEWAVWKILSTPGSSSVPTGGRMHFNWKLGMSCLVLPTMHAIHAAKLPQPRCLLFGDLKVEELQWRGYCSIIQGGHSTQLEHLATGPWQQRSQEEVLVLKGGPFRPPGWLFVSEGCLNTWRESWCWRWVAIARESEDFQTELPNQLATSKTSFWEFHARSGVLQNTIGWTVSLFLEVLKPLLLLINGANTTTHVEGSWDSHQTWFGNPGLCNDAQKLKESAGRAQMPPTWLKTGHAHLASGHSNIESALLQPKAFALWAWRETKPWLRTRPHDK